MRTLDRATCLPLRVFATSALLSCATACTGNIGDHQREQNSGSLDPKGSAITGDRTGANGPAGSLASPGMGGSTSPQTFRPAPLRMRRLTAAQYTHAAADLLGDDLAPEDLLDQDLSIEGFTNIGAAEITTSSQGVAQYHRAALSLASQAFAPARRDATLSRVAGCSAPSADCVGAFVDKAGRHLFRRSLREDEKGRYLSVVSQVTTLYGGDEWKGVEMALAALLESPTFLYLAERGEPDASDPSRLRYSEGELASRMSLFLTDSNPDSQLLDAVDAHDLLTAEGIRAQATRLSNGTAARQALSRFFGEYLNLESLKGLAKDQAVYPQMSATLGAAMKTEIERSIQWMALDTEQDMRGLLDFRSSFINGELADLYGLPQPTGGDFQHVLYPDDFPRAGLLSLSGFLALNAHATTTSATRRGKFIRERLMCQTIPLPPNNVNTNLETDEGAFTKRTMRQRLEVHRNNPSCEACHKMMDPMGLGLENFDGIGVYRTTDQGLEIDATGDLNGERFANVRDLAAIVRRSPEATQCMVRQAFRYAAAHVETDGEEPSLLDAVNRIVGDGYTWRALTVELVSSDAFRYASAPTDP